MAEKSLTDLMRGTEFFGNWPEDTLAAAARHFTTMRHAKGAMIFGRGDPGDTLLLVGEGRVQLSLIAEDGREFSVRHVGEGALLGEIAVLDGGVRSADAIAATPVTLHLLRKPQLEQLIETRPALARSMISLLCRRLRETTRQLEGIALYSVEVRLARHLLERLGDRKPERGRRIPLDLDGSQADLARLIGASRPKVNVALGNLESLGAIKRTSDRLFCDIDHLRRLAGEPDA